MFFFFFRGSTGEGFLESDLLLGRVFFFPGFWRRFFVGNADPNFWVVGGRRVESDKYFCCRNPDGRARN